MRPRVFASLGLVLLAAAPLAAQDFEALLATPVPEVGNSDRPKQYGGGANTTIVPIQSFVPIVGGAPYASQVQGYYGATTLADVTFWAPLEVAVGVQVEQVCLETFDNDDLEAITFLLVGGEAGSAGNPTPAGVPLAGASTGVAPVPGYGLLCATPIGNFTYPLSVRTRGNLNGTGTDSTVQYYILVSAPAPRTAFAVTFGAAVITWRRVVPAGPATATFNDVPTTHIFYRWIETLAASGITGGCGGGGYCPDAPVTRGQMAVFISQSLGLYFPN